MGLWLKPCLISASPVGQAGWWGSPGWHRAGTGVVAQGLVLAVATRHHALERGSGTAGVILLWVFGAGGGKVVPRVWGRPVPTAGSVPR